MTTLLALLALVGSLKFGDAITGWTEPSGVNNKDGTGLLSVAENQALSTTITTYSATSTATAVTYSLLTTGTPFAVASGGELTITTALDFETTSTYTFTVQAVDNASIAVTGTVVITVTVTDVNEVPTFSSTPYSVCVADALAAGTSVFTVTAADQDSGDSVTLSVTGGDTSSEFSFSGSEIQVASGKTLDRATTSSYALQVEADDGTLAATTTVSVTVGECNMATQFAVSILTLLLGFVTALNSF